MDPSMIVTGLCETCYRKYISCRCENLNVGKDLKKRTEIEKLGLLSRFECPGVSPSPSFGTWRVPRVQEEGGNSERDGKDCWFIQEDTTYIYRRCGQDHWTPLARSDAKPLILDQTHSTVDCVSCCQGAGEEIQWGSDFIDIWCTSISNGPWWEIHMLYTSANSFHGCLTYVYATNSHLLFLECPSSICPFRTIPLQPQR